MKSILETKTEVCHSEKCYRILLKDLINNATTKLIVTKFDFDCSFDLINLVKKVKVVLDAIIIVVFLILLLDDILYITQYQY